MRPNMAFERDALKAARPSTLRSHTCFIHRNKSKIVVVALATILCLLPSLTRADEPTKDEISKWGNHIRRAIEVAPLDEVTVSSQGFLKDQKNRYVTITNQYKTPDDVRSILDPIATILQNQEFEIVKIHNRATLYVSFVISLPEICPASSTRFEVVSTMRDFFYIGCQQVNSNNNPARRMARIRSAALDTALRRYFPKELETEETRK